MGKKTPTPYLNKNRKKQKSSRLALEENSAIGSSSARAGSTNDHDSRIPENQNNYDGDRRPHHKDVILTWFGKLHPWDIVTAKATRDKPQWRTEHTRHPLSADVLYQRWENPDELIGVRFQGGKDGHTCYVVIDLDIGSRYHPCHSPESLSQLLEALESIGLCRYILVQSSDSEGLHIYLPLGGYFNTYRTAHAIRITLEKAGFHIEDGQLEIFPNTKTPGVNYKALRLPLQLGSYVLDPDLQPVHNSLEWFIRTWNAIASLQDTELFAHVIETTKLSRDRKSSRSEDCKEWRQRLEHTLKTGWTGEGQTNKILQEVCIYARVFLGMEWDEVQRWAYQAAIQLPGYEEFCNHKPKIKRRIKDWINTNKNSRYYYPLKSAKEPKQPKERLAPPNDVRSDDALERIKVAIASVLAEDGKLPDTVRRCAELICKRANCSNKTLYKHKALWHPEYREKECVTVEVARLSIDLPSPADMSETEQNELHLQQGCVTVEGVRISSISDEKNDVSAIAEKLVDRTVTHPSLLSVNKKYQTSSENLTSLKRSETRTAHLSDSVQMSSKQSESIAQYLELDGHTSDQRSNVMSYICKPLIPIHSIVRRRSDGSLFQIKQVNANGTVWAKRIDQLVPFADVILVTAEVELVSPQIAI